MTSNNKSAVSAEPRIPHRILCRYIGGQWEDEGSGDVFDSLAEAEAAMADCEATNDEGSPLEYRVVTVRP